MKKKVLCALLSATMVAGMLAGCGGTTAPAESSTPAPATSTPEVSAPADNTTAEGSVLNIYC